MLSMWNLYLGMLSMWNLSQMLNTCVMRAMMDNKVNY